MRVCFVVGTLARGGAEKQLVYMLRALQQLGIAADVLCLTKGEAYETEIEGAGFNVKWVGKSTNRMARVCTIIRSIREVRADIIQSSHFYTNLYAGAAGRYLGIQSVGAVRSDLVYEMESHKLTGNLQISLPNVLISNSGVARQRLIDRGIDPKKVEFVRNVVEADVRRPVADSSPGRLKILFVGRLDRNKRPERFVRLAAALTEKLPAVDLQFQVAGDGEELYKLKNKAREMNLTPKTLEFLGHCREMDDVYSRADILVSTSDREGTPNVVLEAMAHGLPVVATAAGGTNEILDSSRGFLIGPGDEAALVKATTQLILNKELRLRLGKEGRRYVREHHSLDGLQSNLLEIYQRVLSRSTGARPVTERSPVGVE